MPTQTRLHKYRPSFDVKFIMSTGAGEGKVLTSDAEGLVSWTSPESLEGVVHLKGTQTVEGNKTFTEIVVSELLRFPSTQQELSAETDNWEPTKQPWERTTPTVAEVKVTGLAGGANGKFQFITNTATEVSKRLLVFVNESAKSTASNRFRFFPAENLVLRPGESVIFMFDNGVSRWRNITNPPQRSTLPTAGAEKTVTTGLPGEARKSLTAIVGDGAKKEWVIKHGLGEVDGVNVSVQTNKEGKPFEGTTVEKFVQLNKTEVEIFFKTAPGAGTIFWVTVTA